MFLRNCWYVFGWNYELAEANGLLGRVIIGEPIVVWRDGTGALHAMEDRCPHRHTPLSKGRVEGNQLRCMYHGMLFESDGRCAQVPGMSAPPPNSSVRCFPIVEKDDWLWVWTGDLDKADKALIPDAYGINNPAQPMRSSRIEYDANYQLINDNLCDLSHADFVHETTLAVIMGASWVQSPPALPCGIVQSTSSAGLKTGKL